MKLTLGSTAPVVVSTAASLSRATFLIEVNRPPTNSRLPETLMSQTWALALALKAVMRAPEAGFSFTSRLMPVTPFTDVKNPPTNRLPSGPTARAFTAPSNVGAKLTSIAPVVASNEKRFERE